MIQGCSLKGNQKIFWLHQSRASSCCRAIPISITDKTFKQCIDLWNNESDQLRQGKRIVGCEHCWGAEDRGEQSYRERHGNYNFYPGEVDRIEIGLDNLCNHMCSYCNPMFSSTWEDSISTHGNFKLVSTLAADNLKIFDISIDVDQWIEEIKHFIHASSGSITVKLTGGEPLMQKQNLQKLLEFNVDKINKLIINTNLNPPNNKFLKWTLENFPNEKLMFDVSIDTAPEFNHIPRAGFDKQKFENNLELLKEKKIQFKFQSAVSVTSVFTVDRYQIWLNQNGYPVDFFELNNPNCLSPGYLPQWVKSKLYNEELPRVVKESLNYMPPDATVRLFEQYNYLRQYFDRTATILNDSLLIEYWEWLKEKYENRNRVRPTP